MALLMVRLLPTRKLLLQNSIASANSLISDDANFINFCEGKTLTNGQQVEEGSCNGIGEYLFYLCPTLECLTNHSVMGDIPAKAQMVSTIITSPQTGEDIEANTDFDLVANVANLQAGSFTNPDVTYYTAPQELGEGGTVVGHTHFSVQDMGANLNPQQALDATKFSFFKGVNDAGDGQGNLRATVTGGLPAGNYRVCTMNSASNHQPVLMPVAQYVPFHALFEHSLMTLIDVVPRMTAPSSPSVVPVETAATMKTTTAVIMALMLVTMPATMAALMLAIKATLATRLALTLVTKATLATRLALTLVTKAMLATRLALTLALTLVTKATLATRMVLPATGLPTLAEIKPETRALTKAPMPDNKVARLARLVKMATSGGTKARSDPLCTSVHKIYYTDE